MNGGKWTKAKSNLAAYVGHCCCRLWCWSSSIFLCAENKICSSRNWQNQRMWTSLTTAYSTSKLFSLPSELIRERKEKFVSKFACCHSLLWQFGIDYLVKIRFFPCICCIAIYTCCIIRTVDKDFQWPAGYTPLARCPTFQMNFSS